MPLTTLRPVFIVAAIGAPLAKLPWLRTGWHAGVTELAAKFLLPASLWASAAPACRPRCRGHRRAVSALKMLHFASFAYADTRFADCPHNRSD